ncbi:LuxR C-terminal-related transcriptional regulator [Actinomadura sp. NPDC047616]|uniref:ATP-binding protein n=1 Tax=Actinomadura sp. NPDC047616 TaxID=3155914 RepID=UPI0033D276C3
MTERIADGWRDGYVPAELNGFIGRRELLSSAKARLADPDVRLLSLTGAGGTGKTRLAMRLASEARRAYPDGAWWVDLASHTDPTTVGRVILDALPIDDVSARETGEILTAALSRRAALLVLDNCEHLIRTLAPLVVRLLRDCPALRIIATSRVPLRCAGEHLIDVPPLSVPAVPDRAVATEYEAVRLFAARACAARADFALTPRNAADVARLVAMLDGIPLAIELAAPLVRVMSVAEIVSMLSDFRLRTLTADVNAPARHRTLWDSLEWSYQLCSPAERLLWPRLAVFAGGFTMDAAAAVAAGGELDAGQVPILIGELAAKSIVVPDTDAIPTRYTMLATVREYGLARLGSRTGDPPKPKHRRPTPPPGEETAAYRRLSAYLLDRAEWCSRNWYGPDETRYLWEARQDLPNQRAVLERCATATTLEEAEVGARLASALTALRLWFFGGTLGEGMRTLLRAEKALADNSAAAPLRLTVLAQAGWIALCLGDEINAETLLRRCDALAPAVSGSGEAAFALAVHRFFIAATALFVHGDPEALARWAAVRDELAAMNDTRVLPMADMFHAIAAAFTAPARDAFAVTGRHLADARAHDATWAAAWAQWARAVAELRHGDPASAVAMFRAALRAQWDIGERWGSVWCVESLAWCAVARGHHEEAALLLGAARNMQRTLGVAIHRLRPWAQAHTACVEQARAALGEAYDMTESYGAQMQLDTAIDLALGQPSTLRADAPPRPRTANRLLTDKQHAVAELIAQGKTDKQIASLLFLSPRTVQSHVSAALRKLGFTSRAEIAAWVAEQQSGPAPRS